MIWTHFNSAIAVLMALCVQASGQGADCSTATPLGVNVPSTYVSGPLPSSGFTGGGACPAVFLEFDAFWEFTAPANGNYLIQFSGAPMDMGCRVHRGNDCAAMCIAAASNESSPVAEVGLTNVAAGETFLIQAGVLNSGDGIADLLITSVVDPCVANGPDVFEPNDSCSGSTPLAPGSYTALNVEVSDPDFYSVVVPAGNILQVVETEDSIESVNYRLKALSCGSYVASGAQGLEWSNTSGLPQRVSLEVLQAPNAPFDCAGYGVDLSLILDPCEAALDDPLEPNDTCAEAFVIADGVVPNLFVKRHAKDLYAVCVGAGDTFISRVNFPSAGANLDLFLHPDSASHCAGSDGIAYSTSTHPTQEVLSWTNHQSVDRRLFLEVRVRQLTGVQNCNTYDLTVTGSQTCGAYNGTPFCDPMDLNSSNQSTQMTGLFVGGSGTGWLLSIDHGPLFQWGIVLVGSAGSSPGIAVGQGRLCLDTSGTHVVGRYNVAGTERNSVGYFAFPGSFLNASGTGGPNNRGFKVPYSLPLPGTPAILPGDTWHFQAWHRDLGGQSNFSNGLSIDF